MTDEESRRMFAEAMQLFENKNYSGALAILDTVNQCHPNSRHVNFRRALCLVELGRVDEARNCQRRLEGRIKPKDFQRLSQAIEKAQPTRTKDSGTDRVEELNEPETESLFTVKKVYPVSGEECSVTGTVKKGVFHPNDTAYIISRSGARIPAPILRIGPADTPLLLIREGQEGMLLLQVDPKKINPGTSIACSTHSSTDTGKIVIKSDTSDRLIIMERPVELIPLEKMIRRGDYQEAERQLNAYTEQNPVNMFAKRMLAQVYLEKYSPLRNPDKAVYLLQTVYQAGGAADLTVTNMLAHAHAESGDPETGLQYLERMYDSLVDINEKRGLAQRIHDFRKEYNLGDLWEIADSYGDIIFRSTNTEDMVHAVVKGTVPRDSKCRNNGVGEFTPIETALAPLFPEIAALFKPKNQLLSPGFLLILGLMMLAIIAALFLPGILHPQQ